MFIIIFTLVLLVLLVILFINFHPVFGAKPDAQTMQRIQKSPFFNGKTFENLEQTKANTLDSQSLLGMNKQTAEQKGFLKQYLFPPKDKNPTKPIGSIALNLQNNPLKNGEFIWLGHSSVLFRMNDKTMITDPVFHEASPVPLFVKPFSMKHAPQATELPALDIVLISHDHYDHLDYKAIKQIRDKAKLFLVPLGIKAHLVKWGVTADKIKEFDWYEETNIEGIRYIFAPTRHFSGRGILNHRQTLWGSWLVFGASKVYFSGDGGYSTEFANLQNKYGDVDIAFIEDGAYNENWRQVHMMPEESAQAAIDIGANVVLPIHWGKYDLSTHQWTEPVVRIKTALKTYNETTNSPIKIATPRIGEVFTLDSLPNEEWWKEDN